LKILVVFGGFNHILIVTSNEEQYMSFENKIINDPIYKLTFDDVLIVPQFSDIKSRSDVDISSNVGKIKLKLPVFSANMRNITGKSMAVETYKHGGIGVLHRFQENDEAVQEYQDTMSEILAYDANATQYSVCVSIGVVESEKERFTALFNAGARFFCIDVAHGHHAMMRDMLLHVKRYDDIVVMAGNVATSQGALELANWGADFVKVGVGPGSHCQTRENTGVGFPQLGALVSIKQSFLDHKIDAGIIADGGIKRTGDISKALVFADAVMLGGMLAGTTETPGSVFEDSKGQFYKIMSGSASANSKLSNGQKPKFVEGMTTSVPFRGHVKYIYRKIIDGVQSSFSYVGAKNIVEFKENAELIVLSYGGMKESKL
jgi:IMP dehydrogenase